MGALELLNRPGLWLLAGLVPLVVLYILKIKRAHVRVPSTWLWQAAKRDLMAKHPFRRLVAELPLILQILALIALAFALSRPATRGGRVQGDHVAIVIDTSASMGTRVGAGPGTRLDDAKRAAKEVTASLSPGADALIIEGAKDARLVAPLERDAKHLRTAIDQLTPQEVEGDLGVAVALAADRLRSLGGSRRIVVLTDGALARVAPLAAAGIPTEVRTVGDAQENAAIVRMDVRAGTDPVTKRDQAQVFVMVQSFGTKPRDLFVTLAVDGKPEPVASRRVLVPPGEKLPVVLTFEPAALDRGAGLLAQISPGDALPADDVAYGRVPAGQRMPVTLASRAAYSWMTRALDADPQVSLQRITVDQLATVNVDPDALVIVEGACPAEVPGHDVVIVAPPEGRCLGIDVGPIVEQPQITSWEAGDARLRFLTMDGVHVARGRGLAAQGATGALLRAGKITLIADASIPGRSGTLIGFDVGDSDWPLKASFVLFARNLVEQARVHRAQGAAGAVTTGDPLRVAVPAGVTTVKVEGPGMAERELAAKGGFAVVPATARAGLYKVRWTTPRVGSVLIPANLTSDKESDVRPRPIAVDASAGAVTAARAPDAHREWGPWLALFAALVLAFDVFWLTRRTTAQKTQKGQKAPPRRAGLASALVAILGVLPVVYEALVHAEVLRETYVRFGEPRLLVFTALAGAWLAWRFMSLPARMSRARRAAVVVLASFGVLGACLAAAEPELGRPLDRMTMLVAIDRSRSVDMVPGADARIRAELKVAERGMHPDDRIGTVVFGAEAATEDPPRPQSDLPPPQRIEVGRDGTDIEAAIRRALAELPADTAGRVVLVTDGVQTRGDALAAAATAVAADVPIDVVVLDQKVVPDVRVVSVRAPTRADEGEALDLRVVTSSAIATDVEVRVKRDGELLHTARAKIQAGEDVLRIRETAASPGLHRYDVEVTALDPAADGAPEDNAGSAFVRVRGPALALVLEGDPGKGAPLAKALQASGFLTDERSTTGVPADVGGLAGFDLVVLSDVRASDLATVQLDALASYARDLGGGLLLMGGDRSMGPGGYARTPIEEVSPVSFDLKKEKRRASLAEVIAIDYSGSMSATVGGQTKLALANEAAAKSASLLGPGDRLGVEHVDVSVAWTIPLGPVNDATGIGKKIRAVAVGGGGIYTDIALKAGYAALEKETVNLKHLLLFADGADAEQIAGCRVYVGEAMKRGITTSVISLGRGSDTPELEVLSKIGGGRFYLIDDATKLPAVFTQETILAARSAIHETPFKVSLGAPGEPTRAVDFAKAPELKGYVVTVPKPRATVLLGGPEGDPVMATWSVGIGRSAAFTSDFKDRWGAGWLGWPGALKLMGQLGRDTARRSDDPRVRLEADAQGGVLSVRADVVGDDGRAQTFRRLTVHVAGPDGFSRDVPLEAVGAGRYAATVPLSRPGTYVAAAKDEMTGEAVGTTGAVLGAGEELRPTGSDRVLLARVAQMTGGKVRDTLAGIYDDRASRRFAYTKVGSLLVLAAALAMLAGVAARRLGTPAFLTSAASRARAAAARAPHERRAAREAEMANAQARAAEQARTNATLLDRKRAAAAPQAPARILGAAPPPGGAPLGPPPIVPLAGPPPPAPLAGPPPPDAGARQLTAAERLAQRRRERK